jgi:hypothetical protein
VNIADLHWSAPSTLEATGAHHGYRQVTIAAGGRLALPDLAELLEPYVPVWDAWLSWIEPGGFILPHIDGGPYRERWQQTLDGDPYLVEHWNAHEVRNDSNVPRIRLVVDRDTIVHPAPIRFRLVDGPAVLLP